MGTVATFGWLTLYYLYKHRKHNLTRKVSWNRKLREKNFTSILLFVKFSHLRWDRYLTHPFRDEIELELKSSFFRFFLRVIKVFVSISRISFSWSSIFCILLTVLKSSLLRYWIWFLEAFRWTNSFSPSMHLKFVNLFPIKLRQFLSKCSPSKIQKENILLF